MAVVYTPTLKLKPSNDSGKPPVSAAETLEIFAFMEAEDESQRKGGKAMELERLLRKSGW